MESGKKIIFDKTHLLPAQFECVVIADTHYMIDVGERPLEFESRRKQTQRAGIALQQVATIGANIVIHMGDLVQEYPETPDFKRAMVEARDQIRASNIYPHYVAGNHDVGDKNDPTMPTHAATAESLAFFHDLFGPSYYSFDRDLCHFIVLNSQIFNSKIAESDAQWQWFESDLATHKNQRLFLFFHLPLYLWDKNEPGLGHYDNINAPDRDRLLALTQKYKIELLFAAHVHYPFYDQIGKTRYFIAPSTSFTRPGFGHLYASAPPPEQGRDDIGKLGFYLLRIRADHTDIHFIRTKGEIKRPARDRLITCTSANLSSPIGITLRHPITPIAELPIAYPSTVRQKTRNDQHFLACIELGAKFARFPWRDLGDPFQRTRLEMLCSEGITPIATFMEPRIASLPEHIEANLDFVQNWEIQIPAHTLPHGEICETLNRCAELAVISLCPIIPNERVHGKQHLRTRMGFYLAELEGLNATLQNADIHLQRALTHVPPNESPWTYIQSLCEHKYSNIDHIDISLELDAQNDCTNARRIAEATFAIVRLPGARLFVDPLIDLDRTMDVTHGLLDTLCNPRAPFHTLRCLNTLLNSPVHVTTFTDEQIQENNRILYLNNTQRRLALVLPDRDFFDLNTLEFSLDSSPLRIYHLCTGETETVSRNTQIKIQGAFPILVVGQADH